jgi:hypothetical protein
MKRDTGDGFLRLFLFFIFSSSFIQRIFISAQPNLCVFSVSKDGAVKKGPSHLCKMREYYWSNPALHFAPIGKVR